MTRDLKLRPCIGAMPGTKKMPNLGGPANHVIIIWNTKYGPECRLKMWHSESERSLKENNCVRRRMRQTSLRRMRRISGWSRVGVIGVLNSIDPELRSVNFVPCFISIPDGLLWILLLRCPPLLPWSPTAPVVRHHRSKSSHISQRFRWVLLFAKDRQNTQFVYCLDASRQSCGET